MTAKRKSLERKAWLNFIGGLQLGCGSAVRQGDVVAFLDEWQADYESRYPHIKVTEVVDEFRSLSRINLGLPGTFIAGRRSFIPVVNGELIQSQKLLDELSEDFRAYYDASYGVKLEAKLAAEELAIRNERTMWKLPEVYAGA